MALRIDTQGRIEAVRFQNQTGSPAAPAAGYSLLYLTTNGLYMETSGGAVIGPFVTGTAPAGGRTLIAENTPSATNTTGWSSISAAYKKITIEGMVRSTQTATYDFFSIKINNDATATNYRRIFSQAYGASTQAAEGADDALLGTVSANSSPANAFASVKIEIIQYANTGFNKQINFVVSARRDASSVHEIIFVGSIEWENTAAINQIDLLLTSGNYVSGSVLRAYGEL